MEANGVISLAGDCPCAPIPGQAAWLAVPGQASWNLSIGELQHVAPELLAELTGTLVRAEHHPTKASGLTGSGHRDVTSTA